MTKRLQSFYDKTLRKLERDGNRLILLNKEKQEALHFTVKFEQFVTELVSKTGPVCTTCTQWGGGGALRARAVQTPGKRPHL